MANKMLTKLEILEEEARRSDIQLNNFALVGARKAASVHDGDFKSIAIDRQKLASKAEEGALLAEEIGHFETKGLFIMEADANSAFSRANRGKQEAKARHWAYLSYVGPQEVQRAIEWCGRDEAMIAEYCQVPLAFLQEALEYYRTQGIEFRFYDGGDA